MSSVDVKFNDTCNKTNPSNSHLSNEIKYLHLRRFLRFSSYNKQSWQSEVAFQISKETDFKQEDTKRSLSR